MAHGRQFGPGDLWGLTKENNPHRVKRKKAKPRKKPSKKSNVKQYGLSKNPFESLSGLRVGKEFLLHVYWSGLDDGGDDGRGHLLQRGKVTADVGLEHFPEPPPTAEEMQQVMFAAKMALLKILRTRKRAKR